MNLQNIVSRYKTRFLTRYGNTLNADQWSALNAMGGCRQGQYGDLLLSCASCSQNSSLPRSCGHRACNQCQQQSNQQWLERQLAKQLPVDYYMATFTLPHELRGLAKTHRKVVYPLLMQCAAETLQTFGLNEKHFESELGLCAVMHTHTRRLDYHPHVHIVVPGGGVHRRRKEWRKIPGKYLFNGRALAKVFRGLLLKSLQAAGLRVENTPEKWIVHCDNVGRGKEALQYLSRYLYRGVISDNNILNDDGDHITFRYHDSKTRQWGTRTLQGEDFIQLILQHVLPKGFRRTRDYGFLHGNAKALLKIVQWVLRVSLPSQKTQTKPSRACIKCPHCDGQMRVVGIRLFKSNPG